MLAHCEHRHIWWLGHKLYYVKQLRYKMTTAAEKTKWKKLLKACHESLRHKLQWDNTMQEKMAQICVVSFRLKLWTGPKTYNSRFVKSETNCFATNVVALSSHVYTLGPTCPVCYSGTFCTNLLHPSGDGQTLKDKSGSLFLSANYLAIGLSMSWKHCFYDVHLKKWIYLRISCCLEVYLRSKLLFWMKFQM